MTQLIIDTKVEADAKWQAFGDNYILFPDSGIELDVVVVTDTEDPANEIMAVYGANKDDAWDKAEQVVREHNNHANLIGVLQRLQTWLIAPSLDAATITEMRKLVNEATQ